MFQPDCFAETAAYGRPDYIDPDELPISDRTQLDYISRDVFTQESRAALLQYCTNSETGYLSSLQVGITNGIGSQTKWLLPIGTDPLSSNTAPDDDVSCAIRELERENFRVETIEVGYVTVGKIGEQGVIWVRLILRDLKNKGPADTDVIINLGKVENFMLKRTFKFS